MGRAEIRWPTRVEPFYASRPSCREALAAGTKGLRRQQRPPYAHDRYTLLLIFQAMDAAGKDGAIRHVEGDRPEQEVEKP